MKKMKVLAFLLALFLMLTAVGCAGDSNAVGTSDVSSSQAEEQPVETNAQDTTAALTAGDAELSERIIRVCRDAMIKLNYSQNIVVIRTLNGMGMAVGFAIDSMESSDILGSIAGDDTVFCVARTHSQAAEFMQKLSRIISA